MKCCGGLKKEDPPNMPPPLGRSVLMTVFVDADHGSNVLARRSHIAWHLLAGKNTVSASTYGSKLLATRIVHDRIVEMRITCKSICLSLVWSNWGMLWQPGRGDEHPPSGFNTLEETQFNQLSHLFVNLMQQESCAWEKKILKHMCCTVWQNYNHLGASNILPV